MPGQAAEQVPFVGGGDGAVSCGDAGGGPGGFFFSCVFVNMGEDLGRGQTPAVFFADRFMVARGGGEANSKHFSVILIA